MAVAIKSGTYRSTTQLPNGTAKVTVHVPSDWTRERLAAAMRPIADELRRRK